MDRWIMEPGRVGPLMADCNGSSFLLVSLSKPFFPTLPEPTPTLGAQQPLSSG